MPPEGRESRSPQSPGPQPERSLNLPHRAAESDAVTCDICGAPMWGIHCKLVCRRCGYVRDCSDP